MCIQGSRIVARSFPTRSAELAGCECAKVHTMIYIDIFGYKLSAVWEPGVPETNLCTLYQRESLDGIVVTTS